STPVPPPTATPAPHPARPVVQVSPASVCTAVGGGTVALVVIGAVLVSMLLAIALSAISVAICALVLRSLTSQERRR
ncbi:SpdD-like protein, partial [Streptomyces boncukensis]|uniref:SpdD-like protein n=1 Tax=Streptomyces boncukensis TaxID=2711219 RepID=UPI0019D0F574